jgi:hypothetical protein
MDGVWDKSQSLHVTGGANAFNSLVPNYSNTSSLSSSPAAACIVPSSFNTTSTPCPLASEPAADFTNSEIDRFPPVDVPADLAGPGSFLRAGASDVSGHGIISYHEIAKSVTSDGSINFNGSPSKNKNSSALRVTEAL